MNAFFLNCRFIYKRLISILPNFRSLNILITFLSANFYLTHHHMRSAKIDPHYFVHIIYNCSCVSEWLNASFAISAKVNLKITQAQSPRQYCFRSGNTTSIKTHLQTKLFYSENIQFYLCDFHFYRFF